MSDESVAITLTPNDLQKINRNIREASQETTKKEVLALSIKDLKDATVDDLKKNGFTAKKWTMMFNLYHKNNSEEYFHEMSDNAVLYENTFPKKDNQ